MKSVSDRGVRAFQAGKLFMESYGDYVKKATMWTKIHALKADPSANGAGAAAAAKPVRKNTGGGLAPKEVNAENRQYVCCKRRVRDISCHEGCIARWSPQPLNSLLNNLCRPSGSAGGAGKPVKKGAKKKQAKKKTKTLKRL